METLNPSLPCYISRFGSKKKNHHWIENYWLKMKVLISLYGSSENLILSQQVITLSYERESNNLIAPPSIATAKTRPC